MVKHVASDLSLHLTNLTYHVALPYLPLYLPAAVKSSPGRTVDRWRPLARAQIRSKSSHFTTYIYILPYPQPVEAHRQDATPYVFVLLTCMLGIKIADLYKISYHPPRSWINSKNLASACGKGSQSKETFIQPQNLREYHVAIEATNRLTLSHNPA